MREKINKAARGEFTYSVPKIKLSITELTISVNAGEIVRGEFVVSNDQEEDMRGVVHTDSHFLQFQTEFFHGKQNAISYQFDATSLQPGEKITGCIRVISDCGTKKLLFEALVGVPSCEVSTGKIRDLFHFTNLAKEKPDEAAALFRNKHFEDIFLYHDNVNIALYEGLAKGSAKGLAMEEFLIAIHKKVGIHITADKTHFLYEDCTQNFQDKIVLTKDNWGYAEYKVTSDSDFVIPQNKRIWTDAFLGNVYTLYFTINVDKMLPGKNYARMTVESVGQKTEILIEANKAGQTHKAVEQKRIRQKQLLKIIQFYMEFCMGHLEQDVYLSEAENVIRQMEQDGMTIVTQLYRTHFGIMEHNEQLVQSSFSFLETQEEKLQKEPLLYGAYLYLKGIWCDEEEVVEEYVAKIRDLYQKNASDWRYLWFLLFLSEEYRSEHKKYEDILKQLDHGCHSPVLYLEICSILNDDPSLLLELSEGVCNAIHWGSKQGFVEEAVATRFCYLAGKMRYFSKVVLGDVCRFYEQYQDDELLAAVCKILMKGQMTTKEAFYWYDLGVEHNLKLTDLYEYYMYSIDESQEMRLQDSTLLYFLYDNHLTVMKKAMLYAYVVRNKENMTETYEAYLPVMEEYTYRQLAEGRINANLAVLYEEFIKEDALNEKTAKELANVMFSYELTCENEKIIGVYVKHRELEGEIFVPLVKGKAVVQLFTENYQIFLADQLDNRYALSIDYTLQRFLNLDFLAGSCYEKGCRDFRLILYLYDGTVKAMQPLVSTYCGEHNEEGKRTVCRLGLLWSSAAGIVSATVLCLFPSLMCRIFGLTQPDVMRLGNLAVRIYSVGALAGGVNVLIEGYYQSCEEEKPAFFMATLRGAAVLIPCTLVFAPLGIRWFWFLFPTTEIVSLLIFLAWKKKNYLSDSLDPNRIFRVTIRNSSEDLGKVLGEVEKFCEKWDAKVRQIYYMTMTVEELCLLIFKKGFEDGNSGYMQITLIAMEDGVFELHIRDNAKIFNPFSMETEKVSKDGTYDMDAMGMLVIKQKAKDFFYRQYQGFNSLIVRV